MADETAPKRRLRKLKNPETVRERASKQSQKKDLSDKKLRGRIYRPLSVLSHLSKKEYNVIPVPKSKAGHILGKKISIRSHFMPKFFSEAWTELKRVHWPNRREAVRLTGAVLIFAVIFAIFVQILGFLFGKLVKSVLLKS